MNTIKEIIEHLEQLNIQVYKYEEANKLCGYELNTYTDAGVNEIIFLDFREENQDPKNADDFIKEFRDKFPNKMIYIWTGYTFDFLLKNRRDILDYIDVVCDGQFVQELYKKGLKYVGSLNQEVIDVQESIKQNKKVLFYENKV